MTTPPKNDSLRRLGGPHTKWIELHFWTRHGWMSHQSLLNSFPYRSHRVHLPCDLRALARRYMLLNGLYKAECFAYRWSPTSDHYYEPLFTSTNRRAR